MDHRPDDRGGLRSRAGIAGLGALFLALAAILAQAPDHGGPNSRWLAAGTGALRHVLP